MSNNSDGVFGALHHRDPVVSENPGSANIYEFVEEKHIDDVKSMESTKQPPKLQRKLKGRQMGMIAIGGTIGTGLFIGSGSTLADAGPAGALVAFAVMGSMVFFVCTSLGEMSTFIPTSDPFNHFGARFLDPALGFAFGWNYWYSWMLTVGSELVACGIIVQYWLPNINSAIWSVISLLVMFSFNAISVRGYGEAEFWMASLKVSAVLVFVVVGILTVTGATGGEFIGGKNWHVEGAPFKDHIVGILKACIVAAFSMQGTEIVGITVGECANPRREVPRVIRSVFWRILFFYIASILIIGLVIPNSNPNLVSASGASDIAISPFTLVIKAAGADWAAHVMNAVVLVTVLSAGNSGLYACTRVLWVLANEGKAPRLLRRVTKYGIPLWALGFTSLCSAIIFCISLAGNQSVYVFLINLSGLTGMGFWLGISLCHWRFRRSYIAQGYSLDDLPYVASFFPFGPVYACTLLVIIIIGQGYSTIWPKFDAVSFVSTYLAIPLFLVFWLTWKLTKRTKWIKLMDIDLTSGTLLEMEQNGDIEVFAQEEGGWRKYTKWFHRKSD
ncbi:hypothetical protein EV176_001855 [Coemansia sp. RSA 451]|nr:hypothetical protein J3F81_002739 [Coemansia sp. RSA 371]KAJ2278236.1 hypothetical protein EV176_001855 [Coemansia sp. RSA 451]